jgi:hypothetical protein
VLRDELGLETSPFLRELEAAILRHNPALAAAPAAMAAPLTRRPVTVLCVVLRGGVQIGWRAGPGDARGRARALSFRLDGGPRAVRRKADDRWRRAPDGRLRCRFRARG